MSNVTLQIGGRSYTVACAEGEETHVTGLGASINDKIQAMGSGHNETRQLLFAALLMADELHEMRHRGGASAPAGQLDAHADILEAIAVRLENYASALER